MEKKSKESAVPVLVRIRPALVRKLSRVADAHRRSRNAEIALRLEESFKSDPRAPRSVEA